MFNPTNNFKTSHNPKPDAFRRADRIISNEAEPKFPNDGPVVSSTESYCWAKLAGLKDHSGEATRLLQGKQ